VKVIYVQQGGRMNVIVQSKTLEITEAIRNFALRQSRKLVKKGQRIIQVTIFLEHVKKKKNDLQGATAKFLVTMPGKSVMAQERSKDLYLAISEACHTALRQIGKVKEKRLAHSAIGEI
jgi:ribosomal subunit interface protein